MECQMLSAEFLQEIEEEISGRNQEEIIRLEESLLPNLTDEQKRLYLALESVWAREMLDVQYATARRVACTGCEFHGQMEVCREG